MLAITLVGGTFILLAAFILGVAGFIGLIVWDAFAGREFPLLPTHEDRAYAGMPARAA